MHNRAVDQLIDEKRISDRLVDRLSTLEAELTEAQNTKTQMREMLKDALELGLIAHAPGCSGGIRTSPRASDGEYPYPCDCGYIDWIEKLKEVIDETD